jgi:hypothetical protein
MVAARRPLQIYVAFHPNSPEGQLVALHLGRHFRERDPEADGEGLGIPVEFRSEASPSGVSANLDIARADHTAVVFLIDNVLLDQGGSAWEALLASVLELSERSHGTITLYPVAMSPRAVAYGAVATAGLQSLRWFDWDEDSVDFSKSDRLVSHLTHRLCVDVQVGWLAESEPQAPIDDLVDKVDSVQIFLSHAKADGEDFAKRVRDRIFASTDLRSFFDVRNLPPARRWAPRLEHEIARSAFLAIHTDMFSSREWCCREVLYAKRHIRPTLVVNIMERGEQRSFPYLGNAPVLRVDGASVHHIDRAIARLLDQVLCFLLWERRTRDVAPAGGSVLALPRAPEAADLAHLAAAKQLPTKIVYPDPPLARAELELLEALCPTVGFVSLTQLLSEG